MSIDKALQELYRERDRIDAERARIDEAIDALEGLDPPEARGASGRKPTRKPDGRSAPKPPIECPFCASSAKGMAGLAAHVRGTHPDQYPGAYEAWKAGRQ